MINYQVKEFLEKKQDRTVTELKLRANNIGDRAAELDRACAYLEKKLNDSRMTNIFVNVIWGAILFGSFLVRGYL